MSVNVCESNLSKLSFKLQEVFDEKFPKLLLPGLRKTTNNFKKMHNRLHLPWYVFDSERLIRRSFPEGKGLNPGAVLGFFLNFAFYQFR